MSDYDRSQEVMPTCWLNMSMSYRGRNNRSKEVVPTFWRLNTSMSDCKRSQEVMPACLLAEHINELS
jgi:hypothetical protein